MSIANQQVIDETLSEAIEWSLQNEQFFSYIMARTSYIQWKDNDAHFVLDQYT